MTLWNYKDPSKDSEFTKEDEETLKKMYNKPKKAPKKKSK